MTDKIISIEEISEYILSKNYRTELKIPFEGYKITTEKHELKPCPFCNGKSEYLTYDYIKGALFHCTDCGEDESEKTYSRLLWRRGV